MKKVVPLCLLFLVILGCDQALKFCAFHHIQGSTKLFSLPFNIDLSLQLATNKGGPWGIFSQWQWVLLAVRICVCIGLIFYLFKKSPTFYKSLSLVFILSGALSNIVDTLYYGFVIDMIHFTFSGNSFGIFNLADAAIFCGIVLILFEKNRDKNAARMQ